jgi:hypothetical protein
MIRGLLRSISQLSNRYTKQHISFPFNRIDIPKQHIVSILAE